MNRSRQRRFLPDIDTLDPRCLLSASPLVSLIGGQLTVLGTAGDDVVTVNLTVRAQGRNRGYQASGWVSSEGGPRIRVGRVQSLLVMGNEGNDRITVKLRGAMQLPIRIDGGSGDDQITGSRAAELILGGAGADTIWGGGGLDQLEGEGGRDRINGILDPAETPPVVADHPPVSPPVNPPSPPVSPPQPPPSTPPSQTERDVATVREIIDRTNAQRIAEGLPALRVNPLLSQMAQIQADQMATLMRMEHELTGRYPTMVSRAEHVGYRYAWLGENIAYNYPDAANVTFGWINSPGHRANILFSEFTEIGVAMARNAYGEPYYCQVFGRSQV